MESDTNERQLTFISEQVQLCMLPSLKENLDDVQLLPAHFESYHSLLRQELPKLYDVLQQNERILFKDNSCKLVRAELVILFCELTASSNLYTLENNADHLLNNASELLKNLLSVCRIEEETHIFSYYEEKLRKDCWKSQLGAVHGYVRFMEQRYSKEHRIPTKWLTFSLSVGLNVRECYQLEYKQLGLRIFMCMLRHAHPADIQHVNIHSVIYDTVFQSTYTTETVDGTECIWNCLCLCLDHFTDLDAYAWNQCDDMLQRLIENVTLSSDVKLSICLLQFITKLGYYFTLNSDEVRAVLASDLTQPGQLEACQEVCCSLNVCTNYRWAKSIFQMLVMDSEKLLQGPETCAQLLNAMLRCYLVCILPIPLPALNIHLREFYSKFVASLLQSLAQHREDERVVKLTNLFIAVFIFQQKNNSPDAQVNNIVKEIPASLQTLHEILNKY